MTIMETENKEKFMARTMYHKLKHLRRKQTNKQKTPLFSEHIILDIKGEKPQWTIDNEIPQLDQHDLKSML